MTFMVQCTIIGIEMRLIKRYKNRRLYDTERKKVITLDELGDYIHDGVKFVVFDNSSGEDITLTTLTAALGDQLRKEKQSKNYAHIIKELAVKGGAETVDILRKSVLFGLGLFTLSKERAEEIVDELIKKGELAKGERAEAVRNLVDKAEKRSKELKDKVEEQVKKATEKFKSQTKTELQSLNEKIDKLAETVANLEKKIG